MLIAFMGVIFGEVKDKEESERMKERLNLIQDMMGVIDFYYKYCQTVTNFCFKYGQTKPAR